MRTHNARADELMALDRSGELEYIESVQVDGRRVYRVRTEIGGPVHQLSAREVDPFLLGFTSGRRVPAAPLQPSTNGR